MTLFLIVALLITIAASVFAVQNATAVTVTFLAWKFEGSLALVLPATFCLGVIVSLLISIPNRITRTRLISHQKRKIDDLERSLGEKSRVPAVADASPDPKSGFRE